MQDVLRSPARLVSVPYAALTVTCMVTPEQGETIARELLASPLPRRWAHTQGVAARALSISPILGDDADLLTAAAWLHDIGYAPDLAQAGTGFHPLDGARHLRDSTGAPDIVSRLVAHHSCALAGAAEMGLAEVLESEFPSPPASLADALTYCDMTTSPDGMPVAVSVRLAEIRARYGPGHEVTRAITNSADSLTAAVIRVSLRLATSTALPQDAYNPAGHLAGKCAALVSCSTGAARNRSGRARSAATGAAGGSGSGVAAEAGGR
jgi:HD domain